MLISKCCKRTLILAVILVAGATTIGLPVRAVAFDAPDAPAAQITDPRALEQIERLFTTAQSALAKGVGGAVLPLLSRTSRSRIEAVQSAARAGSAANLTPLSPAEKVVALSLQRFVPHAQLQRWTTPELINRALAEHWLGLATIAESSLGKLTFNGSRASAPLLLKGRPSLVSVAFVRDGGQWRIDLGRTLAVADELLRAIASLSGRGEEDAIREWVGHLHTPPH